MAKENFSKSFRRSLLLSATGGLIVVCLLVASVSIYPLHNVLKQQQESHLLSVVYSKKMTMEEFLSKARETALQITSRTRIRDYLEDYNHSKVSLQEFVAFTVPKLEDALVISENAVAIRRYDQAGHLAVAVGLKVPEEILAGVDITPDKIVLYGPVFLSGEEPYLAVSTPIMNRDKIRVGTDLVFFSLEQLRAMIQDYTGLGQTGELILGRQAEQGPEVFYPLRSRDRSRDYGSVEKHLVSVKSIVEQAADGDARQFPDILRLEHETVVLDRLETGWLLLLCVHKKELYAPVYNHLAVVLCVVGVVVLLGVFLLVRRLRPLAKMAIVRIDELTEEINGRLEAEAALRESEQLYRSLFESFDFGVTLIDDRHAIIMANHAQGRFFNKNSAQFIGRKCFAEFEKRDHVCSHCPGVSAMEKKETVECVTEGVRDDGSRFTVKIKAIPILDENNEATRFIEVVEDITESLKMKQDLSEEKERLMVTLRSIGDGVITTDTAGRIVLLNKVAEELTGWKLQDAVGRPLEEVFNIINEQSRQSCSNPVERVLESGLVVGLANHTVLVSRDGREIHITDSGAPIRDAESKIVGVVLVFRDVTEEVRSEKERLKIQKLESIGLLAGGIAHDFNNILTSILGNINLALFDDTLNKETRNLLSDAEKASLRAKELTQQLLTFARGGEPVRQAASLEEVVRESADFVLHGDNVVCHYHFSEDLWLVDIDRGQISQVIQNIVLNAGHAMPDGGVIRIRCENVTSDDGDISLPDRSGRFVRISIEDQGVGIPEKFIEKVFDPYFTTKKEGCGLGLAISQSVIQKHHGSIFVHSTPGQGSVFTILLPASEHAVPEERAMPDELKTAAPAHILIMDDEQIVLDITLAMLSKLGHSVRSARDGEEAIRCYEQGMQAGTRFDLVIMDLTIPGGMGGKDAVREILERDPDAKVIVASGYSNDPILANYRDYGFCAAIVKPFQFQELSEVVNQALAG